MLRRSSITLWLALYTAVSLCSPAMHELTGIDHAPRPAATGGAETGEGARRDSKTPRAFASPGDPSDEAHCPVCSYQAQAQAAPDAAPAAAHDLVTASAEDRPAAVAGVDSPLPSRPRAPPQSSRAQA